MDKFLNFAAGRKYETATYLMVNLTKRRYVVLTEDPVVSVVYLSTKASLREVKYQLDRAGFEQVDTRGENENAE